MTLNTEKAQVLRAGTSRAILRLNKSIYYSISIPISFLVGLTVTKFFLAVNLLECDQFMMNKWTNVLLYMFLFDWLVLASNF